ncbi:MAG: FHA domain-containing protein [Anaerolineales bacterium]|jgi:hypothetical protein
MTPQVVVLLLRLGLGLALYAFLGSLLVILWRDLRHASVEGENLPQAALEFQAGTAQMLVMLQVTNLIGRAPDNSVVLQDETVSARHARISYASGQWILEDLGSKNGTFVNEIPLDQELVVTYGDQITFGSMTALFTSGSGDQDTKQSRPAEGPEIESAG